MKAVQLMHGNNHAVFVSTVLFGRPKVAKQPVLYRMVSVLLTYYMPPQAC